MFENLVVPVDLEPFSFDAVPFATSMAAQVAGTVDVVTVVDRLADVPSARIALERAVDRLGPQPVETNAVVLADRSVASAVHSTHRIQPRFDAAHAITRARPIGRHRRWDR